MKAWALLPEKQRQSKIGKDRCRHEQYEWGKKHEEHRRQTEV